MLRVNSAVLHLGGKAILDSVSLSIEPGELIALVGPNGAGKSTMLAVMAGDLELESGEVTLDGIDLGAWKALELARRRGVLQQEHQLSFGFRAEEVVRMGRSPWAKTKREDDDDIVVADAMARADVTHLSARIFPTLSGGEKGRTSFARIISQETPLVLLDEPTAALDLKHQDQVLAEARKLASSGTAVVAVVHDLSVAAAYADRIVVLAGGKIVADGAPEEVLTAELIGEVYQHPVDVLTHQGRLVVVPKRLHSVPNEDVEEEKGPESWRVVR